MLPVRLPARCTWLCTCKPTQMRNLLGLCHVISCLKAVVQQTSLLAVPALTQDDDSPGTCRPSAAGTTLLALTDFLVRALPAGLVGCALPAGLRGGALPAGLSRGGAALPGLVGPSFRGLPLLRLTPSPAAAPPRSGGTSAGLPMGLDNEVEEGLMGEGGG